MKYKNLFFVMSVVFCMSWVQSAFTMLATHRADRFLFKICVEGYPLESVRTFVEQVAHVNTENEAQDKPLHLACIFGHIDIVKLLIQSGADINLKMRNSSTPLHCAVCSNRYEIVKYLLAAGADFDVKNSSGLTPFDLACRHKKKPIMELFTNQSSEDIELNDDCVDGVTG